MRYSENPNRSIDRKTVFEVLFRMGLCILAYVLIVILFFAIMVASFVLPILGFINMVEGDSGYFDVSDVRLVVIVIALWIGTVTAFVYVIIPLFKFKRPSVEYKVEVNEKNCPDLYNRIVLLCKKVGVRKPRHIYLDADANAYVYMNNKLGGLLFWGRKNLNIGLGLFSGLSIQEIESIIAHELGHFSQKSMKLTNVLYYIHTILRNLVISKPDEQPEDSEDNHLGKDVSDFMIGFVRFITYRLFLFEQKGYSRLSLQMEYDADAISCQTVGSDDFVSALCKARSVGGRIGAYDKLVFKGLCEKKIPKDYFYVFNQLEHFFESFDGISISYDKRMLEMLPQFCTRISINSIWDTHPATQDRIKAAKQLSIPTPEDSIVSAWSVISDEIVKQVGDKRIEELKLVASVQWKDFKQPETIDAEDLIEEYPKNEVSPWFYIIMYRHLCINSLDNTSNGIVEENPFTRENSLLIKSYEVARADMDTLIELNRQNPQQEINYDGKHYLSLEEPIQRHIDYLNNLSEKCSQIDNKAMSYLLSCAKNVELLKQKYNNYFALIKAYNECTANSFVDGMRLLFEVDNRWTIYNKYFKDHPDLHTKYADAVLNVYSFFERVCPIIVNHLNETDQKTLRTILGDGFHPITDPKDLERILELFKSLYGALDNACGYSLKELYDYAAIVVLGTEDVNDNN
jgi:Zn-dependent protease with chaperone function